MLQSKARDSQVALGMGLELWGQRRDGTEFPVDVTVSPLQTDDGTVLTAIIRDITERKRFETQLQHLADHDALTDLFNRRRFDQELAEIVRYAARYGGGGALFLLDLDRFKYVNDTRGHKAGDEVIRAVGRALRENVRKTDVVARLGGDEFAVLLRDADREAAERIAEGMLETIRERRLPLEGQQLSITTSIGIVLFGDEEPSVEDLMVNADLAMYAAKEAGGNRFHVAIADGGADVGGMQLRLDLGRPDPPRARRGPLRPLLPADHGARLRPDHAVRAAAADDRRRRRDHHARRVHRHRRALRADPGDRPVGRPQGDPPARRARRPARGQHLRQVDGRPRDPGAGRARDRATGIDPSRLVFEITETAAIANMEQARAFAERLTRLGCRFALDDFGAGFSSFYYLKYLPLDYLKIDGDFIRSLTSSVTDQLVVKSMVDIARGMGMKTIAEFVEASETVEMLREKGVDYSQGYFHGAPRPVAGEFAAAHRAVAIARARARRAARRACRSGSGVRTLLATDITIATAVSRRPCASRRGRRSAARAAGSAATRRRSRLPA